MGTYASKLLSSGLNDDNIYVASKHLCKEIWQKLSEAALAESNDKKKTNSDLLQFQNMEKQKFPTALTGMRALDKKIQSGQNAPNN
jgi:nitrogen fixation protein FixH